MEYLKYSISDISYFVKKYIFVCLLFLISAQIIQSEDKCSNNPSACTTNEICIIATTLKNGKVLWQGESVKEYVLEAKKRNLTEEICAKKNCRYDPVYCSETLICKKATRNNNGESVWKDDFSKDYIQEAKSRGLSPLSCEIMLDIQTKKEEMQFTTQLNLDHLKSSIYWLELD